MTHDDIIRMAQKAGPLTQGPFEEWCKRFANLVAAHEREAIDERGLMKQDEIIKLAREAGFKIDGDSWIHAGVVLVDGRKSIDEQLKRFAALAAAHEREACAKVCEAGINNATDWDNSYRDQCCENRAAAIRARSQA